MTPGPQHRCCVAAREVLYFGGLDCCVFDPFTGEPESPPNEQPCWYLRAWDPGDYGEADAVRVTHCPWCGVYLPENGDG